MDDTRRLAEEGAEEGLVVMAEHQTSGRGRFGRNWVSGSGNIHLSVLFRPTLEVLRELTMISAVSVVRAIRKTTALDPRIKWPNDVLISGKKISGVLVETAASGTEISYAVVGIGINIGLDTTSHPEISDIAGCLEDLASAPVARDEVLRQLLIELDTLYAQAREGGSAREEWQSLLDTIGQRVMVSWRDETWEGVAVGVDSSGNLMLRVDNGELLTMTAGDVSLSGQTS